MGKEREEEKGRERGGVRCARGGEKGDE